MGNRSLDLTLYLDESGTFEEPAFSAGDRAEAANQSAASQLVGFLAPLGADQKALARRALEVAYRHADLILGEEVHGTELKPGPAYDALIDRLLDELRASDWQPVRLVNLERVGYGDHAATYTNMVAELLLRIFEQKQLDGYDSISLRVVGARVKLNEEEDGTPILLDPNEYQRRIDEYLAFAAVRRGLAAESLGWRISELKLGSGRTWPELQVCDLLSNASFRNFAKCGDIVGQKLNAAFACYNYSLAVPEFLERVDNLLSQDALGLALRALSERLSPGHTADPIALQGRARLETVVHRLATLGATSRDAYLREITAWLEQVINLQRAFDRGERLIKWFQTEVLAAIINEAPAKEHSLDWFAFTLHSWALTLFNHLGKIASARSEVQRIDDLLPQVAQRWEHAELVAGALVTQAVHLTDCFDYDGASTRARAVVDYYGSFSDLLCEALPDIFPNRVRSELRGKALGTRLQAEMYAALRQPERIDEARRLSDDAIEEFAADDDRSRQFQYRCELETIADRFIEARSFLAKSLGLSDESSHVEIGVTIRTLEHAAQGFALLHWLRLGAKLCAAGGSGDRQAFLEALQRSRLLQSAWCVAEQLGYPAHGIRRRAAFIFAAEGQTSEALSALGQLRRLDPLGQKQLVLVLVLLAAQIEIAGLTGEQDRRLARRLLDCAEPERLGANQLLSQLERTFTTEQFVVERIAREFKQTLGAVLQGRASQSESRLDLLKLASVIPY